MESRGRCTAGVRAAVKAGVKTRWSDERRAGRFMHLAEPGDRRSRGRTTPTPIRDHRQTKTKQNKEGETNRGAQDRISKGEKLGVFS